ncbi:MAG: hypothetical protein HOV94_27685 [Saccharothrix sp.]|nr:hypothetical protein [Saccharothrix sp.]
MAVDVQLMGERAAVDRLAAAVGGLVELRLKPREYPMRRVLGGVRRFGEARPVVSVGGTELAVREAVVALPTGVASEPSVRLRLTGEVPEILAVLPGCRALLHLALPPRDFDREGGFGIDLYLHIYTGHLPAVPRQVARTAVADDREQPVRGRRYAPSERADRRGVTGQRALPRGRR